MIAIASLAKCPWYASTSSRRVPRTPARGARPPCEFCIWNALNQLYAYVICVFAHLVSKKSPYGTSRWFQSRPRFYMAGSIADIFAGGRMAEWLRLADCEILTIKLRGINYQYAHLVSEKSPYGTSRWFQSRPRFHMDGSKADILGGRMAEWLRPADCEILTIKLRGINYQFAHLVFEKKSI